MSCETGCGRCIMFAVDHENTVAGWLKVAVRFAWHRWSGQCERMRRSLGTHPPAPGLGQTSVGPR